MRINGVDSIQTINRTLRAAHNQQFFEERSRSAINDASEFNFEGNTEGFTNEKLQEAVEKANQHLVGVNAEFLFTVHEGTGRTLVQLINKNTGDIIREIPPRKMLDVIAGIWEMSGLVVDQKE